MFCSINRAFYLMLHILAYFVRKSVVLHLPWGPLFSYLFLSDLALDVTANYICEIHCLALDGFKLNTVHQLSNKGKTSQQSRDAGIQSGGFWVGSKNVSSELRSPLPSMRDIIKDPLLIVWRRKSSAPSGFPTRDLSVARHVLYRCAITTALI